MVVIIGIVSDIQVVPNSVYIYRFNIERVHEYEMPIRIL